MPTIYSCPVILVCKIRLMMHDHLDGGRWLAGKIYSQVPCSTFLVFARALGSTWNTFSSCSVSHEVFCQHIAGKYHTCQQAFPVGHWPFHRYSLKSTPVGKGYLHCFLPLHSCLSMLLYLWEACKTLKTLRLDIPIATKCLTVVRLPRQFFS